jgi:hypothetical protein
MSLDESLDRVTSLESFLEFVDALGDDRHANGSTWENWSIETYLEAASACARDSMGRESGMNEEPSWRTSAIFLYSGTFYELICHPLFYISRLASACFSPTLSV